MAKRKAASVATRRAPARKTKAGAKPARVTKAERDYQLALEAEAAERAERKRERDRAYKAKRRKAGKVALGRAELARQAASQRVQAGRGRVGDWRGALEGIRDHVAAMTGSASLSVELPKGALGDGTRGKNRLKGTPWALIGTIEMPNVDYAALSEIFAAVEADNSITRSIGENRYARIAVLYNGPEERGSRKFAEREWTVSEISTYDTAISRAREETDPEEPGSVGARYKSTSVSKIIIWIADREGNVIPF